MGERIYNRISESEAQEAADFLRNSLISHKITGVVVQTLLDNSRLFSEAFCSATTPYEVLSTISLLGFPGQARSVAEVVNNWINNGNERNVTIRRRIVRDDFDRWAEGLENGQN